jgi:hypothetical protein
VPVGCLMGVNWGDGLQRCLYVRVSAHIYNDTADYAVLAATLTPLLRSPS